MYGNDPTKLQTACIIKTNGEPRLSERVGVIKSHLGCCLGLMSEPSRSMEYISICSRQISFIKD